MAFVRRQIRRSGLGSSAVIQAVDAVSHILTDPALPQVAGLVLELHDLEQSSGGDSTPGVGLSRVVGPLQTFVSIRRTGIPLVAIAAAAVAVPFVLGFLVGRR